jgi:hypothetical protein
MIVGFTLTIHALRSRACYRPNMARSRVRLIFQNSISEWLNPLLTKALHPALNGFSRVQDRQNILAKIIEYELPVDLTPHSLVLSDYKARA